MKGWLLNFEEREQVASAFNFLERVECEAAGDREILKRERDQPLSCYRLRCMSLRCVVLSLMPLRDFSGPIGRGLLRECPHLHVH